MADMSVDSLKNNVTNPQRTYTWDVIIPSPIGDGDTKTMQVRCQSTNIPGRSVGKIHVPYKQSGGVEYPGKLTYPHTWVCTFIEGEDKKIFSSIYSWMQDVVHDRTNVSKGDLAIKTDLYLRMLSTAWKETLAIKLVGCYPESVADVSLAYDDEATVAFEVTWSYDRWEEA